MDLIDKALQLYDEIESRQCQLREILVQLQAQMAAAPVSDEAEPEKEIDPELDSEPELVVEPVAEPEVAPIPQSEPIVVSRQRPDLWKSLTINDRFRFRRELFAGDDAAMKAAISCLSEMDSLSEADAYLANMPWESDSEAVSEFMTILSNHFSRF